jgi:hypothetical protein
MNLPSRWSHYVSGEITTGGYLASQLEGFVCGLRTLRDLVLKQCGGAEYATVAASHLDGAIKALEDRQRELDPYGFAWTPATYIGYFKLEPENIVAV